MGVPGVRRFQDLIAWQLATPLEFMRYLRMARGEVGEVQTHLEIGRRRNYFDAEQLSRSCPLADRTMATITNLLKSKLKTQKRRPHKNVRRPT